MDLAYLLALHSINGMGSQRLKAILEYYRWDACSAWEDYRNWCEIGALTAESAQTLSMGREAVDIDRVYEKFLDSGASVAFLGDENYPRLLKEI